MPRTTQTVLRRFALGAWCFCLSACAWLMNSGRPSYNGPVVKPLWHNATLAVTLTPVIQGNVVYVVGHSWDSSESRVFAFYLQSGLRKWVGRTEAAGIIAVAGSTILTDTGQGAVRALSAATGEPVKYVAPRGLKYATFADGKTYAAGAGQWVAALGPSGSAPWTTRLPIEVVARPVVAGASVYVYGIKHVDEMTPDFTGAYALDRVTGAIRWRHEGRERFGKQRYNTNTKAMGYTEQPDKRLVEAIVADSHSAFISEHRIRADILHTTGVLTAIDLAGHVRWQHLTPGWCPDAPNLLDNDAILVCDAVNADLNGATYRALSRATGATLWQGTTAWWYEHSIPYDRFAIVSDRQVHQVLNEMNQTSPDSWLTFVDRKSGRELWRTEMEPLEVFTLPAAGSGIVVVGSAPFEFDSPSVAGSRELAGLWAWPLRTQVSP